jgi:hypothetical protein
MVITANNHALNIAGTMKSVALSQSSRDTRNAKAPSVKKTITDKRKIRNANLRCHYGLGKTDTRRLC